MKVTRLSTRLQRGSEIAPPEDLYARIRAAIASERSSQLRTGTRITVALVAIPAWVTVIVLAASELVYHQPAAGLKLGVQSPPALAVVLSLLAALTLVSTLITLWRGNTGFGFGAPTLAGIAAIVAPIYGALILLVPLHSPDAVPSWVNISPWGLRCFLIAMLVGLTVSVACAAALRRAVPVAGRVRAAAIGSAAGAWAGLALFIFCPSGDPQHLLVGHVLPVIVLVGISSLGLGRMLQP